jgi:uncharacterized membrane protein YjjP (DUF1212 family)
MEWLVILSAATLVAFLSVRARAIERADIAAAGSVADIVPGIVL